MICSAGCVESFFLVSAWFKNSNNARYYRNSTEDASSRSEFDGDFWFLSVTLAPKISVLGILGRYPHTFRKLKTPSRISE